MDPGHVLFLHWHPLPQGCSRLVANLGNDIPGRVVMHEIEAEMLSPTAALLRLWARTGDPMPGHTLKTLCDTADLLARYDGEIDWARVWSDCGRLGLVGYGETYLRALPGSLGGVGIRTLGMANAG